MKQFKFNLLLGIMTVALGAILSISLAWFPLASLLGLPFIAIGLWQLSAFHLKVYHDFFEYKPCFFFFSHFVSFADIESFIVRDNRIIIFARVKGRYKKISVSLGFFRQEDRGDLIGALKRGYRQSDTQILSSVLTKFSPPPSSLSLTF